MEWGAGSSGRGFIRSVTGPVSGDSGCLSCCSGAFAIPETGDTRVTKQLEFSSHYCVSLSDVKAESRRSGSVSDAGTC